MSWYEQQKLEQQNTEEMWNYLCCQYYCNKDKGKSGWTAVVVIAVIIAVLDAILSSVILTVVTCLIAAAALAAYITYKVRGRLIVKHKIEPTRLDRLLFRLAGMAAGFAFGFKHKKTERQVQREYEMMRRGDDPDN